jgi:hypothetical protein
MADFLLVSSNVGQVSYLPAQEGILRYSAGLLNGPAAVCLNHRVNFGHEADGVVQGSNASKDLMTCRCLAVGGKAVLQS